MDYLEWCALAQFYAFHKFQEDCISKVKWNNINISVLHFPDWAPVDPHRWELIFYGSPIDENQLARIRSMRIDFPSMGNRFRIAFQNLVFLKLFNDFFTWFSLIFSVVSLVTPEVIVLTVEAVPEWAEVVRSRCQNFLSLGSLCDQKAKHTLRFSKKQTSSIVN